MKLYQLISAKTYIFLLVGIALLPFWPEFDLFVISIIIALKLIFEPSFIILKTQKSVIFTMALIFTLGIISHIASLPLQSPSPIKPEFILSSSTMGSNSRNLITQGILYNLRALSHNGDTLIANAKKDGMFSVHRYINNSPTVEIFTEHRYFSGPDRTYVQSVYVRSGALKPQLQFTFFTARGHNVVPTISESLGNGVWRLSAIYTTKYGDQYIRALDLFVNPMANWIRIDIGYPQLEQGTLLTPYNAGPVRKVNRVPGVVWWCGIGAISVFAFVSSNIFVGSFRALAGKVLCVSLFFRFVVALCQVGGLFPNQDAYALGLQGNSNLLGHSSVAISGLVWILAGVPVGGIALLISIAIIWCSGSMAALFGFGILALGWCISYAMTLKSHFWLFLRLLVVLVIIGLFWSLLPFKKANSLDSMQSRIQIWKVAFEIFQQRPSTGIGIAEFPYAYEILRPSSPIVSFVPHAHNLILQLLSESGLIVTVGYMGLLAFFSYRFFQRKQSQFLWVIGAIVIMNLYDMTWFYAAVNASVWTIFGLSYSEKDGTFSSRIQA
jgi:O-Antigen ligase